MSGGLEGPAPEERPSPAGRRNARGVRVDPDAAAASETRRAVLAVTVDHEPGVLSEVSGLFSRRQFNIESLTVGPSAEPGLARMTVVTEEPDPEIEQLKKQVAKLVPVVGVKELPDDAIRRELALVKVDGDEPDRVRAVAEMYDADTVDACPETVTVEVTGSRQKVEAAIDTLAQFHVREIVRTGTTAMARSTAATTDGGDPGAEAGRPGSTRRSEGGTDRPEQTRGSDAGAAAAPRTETDGGPTDD